MYKRFFSILQYILFLGGGIFLVWWQLKSMTPEQWKSFVAAFEQADYRLAIPVILISLSSHVSRAMRWKLLMEPLGYFPSLKNTFAVTMIGYLANSAVPRLGELLKCTFLARYEKLKVDKLVGTIIVERTFDLLCFFLFIVITILIQLPVVGSYFSEKFNLMLFSSGTSIWARVFATASLLIFGYFTIRYIFKRFPRNTIISKIKIFIRGIAEGFSAIKNLQKRRSFILHTLFIWCMYLLQIYIGFSAMEGTRHLDIKAACSVLTLASLSMIVTPGGIGSFPIFVKETLLIYAIPATLGTAFGWLMWGISTGIIITAGLIALIVIPYINKKKSNEISRINPQENS